MVFPIKMKKNFHQFFSHFGQKKTFLLRFFFPKNGRWGPFRIFFPTHYIFLSTHYIFLSNSLYFSFHPLYLSFPLIIFFFPTHYIFLSHSLYLSFQLIISFFPTHYIFLSYHFYLLFKIKKNNYKYLFKKEIKNFFNFINIGIHKQQ